MQENVFFFLTMKKDVIFFYDHLSLEEGLRLMRKHGFTAMPVINTHGEYVGTINEGDFLWYFIDHPDTSYEELRDTPIKDLIRNDFTPPMMIDATLDELFAQSLKQNFVPIVDDRNIFIGIVTRSNILKYLMKTQKKVLPLSKQGLQEESTN